MPSVSAVIYPATIADAEELLPKLRKMDLIEIAHAPYVSAREALWYGVLSSEFAYSIKDTAGRCLAMFGVVYFSPGVGSPWLLASDELFDKAKVGFLKASRSALDAIQTNYPVLVNRIHKDNVEARRWLEWCGFRVDDEPCKDDPELRLFSKIVDDASE